MTPPQIDTCPNCSGDGRASERHPHGRCGKCHGTGQVTTCPVCHGDGSYHDGPNGEHSPGACLAGYCMCCGGTGEVASLGSGR